MILAKRDSKTETPSRLLLSELKINLRMIMKLEITKTLKNKRFWEDGMIMELEITKTLRNGEILRICYINNSAIRAVARWAKN